MGQKKNKKESLKRKLLTLLEMIFVLSFIYAALQLASILLDYGSAVKEYNNLSQQLIRIEEVDVISEKEEVPSKEVENILDLSYDYKVPEFSINLEIMKERNPDTIGWIILPDSKINYPIVKSKDNTEYLTTTFEGKKASSGAIFMDRYCEEEFEGRNTLIYGHNMKNGSMFRALNDLVDKEFFWRHHIFCIDTGKGFENYEIISCYKSSDQDLNALKIQFDDEVDYENWLQCITKKSIYACASYDVSKKTITLSTCRGKANGPGRFIVHLQKKN